MATDSAHSRERAFGYMRDPICLCAIAVYAVNRWLLKPHDVGGNFARSYLNDLLCLPIFLPVILAVVRRLGLRSDDAAPRLWEVVQHALIFSVVFEVMLPRYPRVFTAIADPWDATCYLIGGMTVYLIWRARAASWPVLSADPGSAVSKRL